MDTKAAFEKWWEDIGCFANCSKKEAIIIWQESREAIEIELPDKILEVVADTLIHGRVMANDMLRNCTTAITSHGIRIKGKTE